MRRRDERGSITPFVVIVSLGIILLAALVIDGGRQLNAKGRAVAYAQEAARAGSQAIDVTDPRLDLVPALAMRAARAYCSQAMSQDPQLAVCRPSLSTVNDPAGTFLAVRVDVQVRINAILMGMINRPSLEAGGIALARPVSGISSPDKGKVSAIGPPTVSDPTEENPGTLTPGDVTMEPCVPVPDKPKDPKPDDPKPRDSDKPRPNDPKPSKWPPDLPPGQEYCPSPTDVPAP